MDLVKDVSLSQQALAKARADALELEKRAYELKDFYRKTQPAKPTLLEGTAPTSGVARGEV